MIIYNQLEHLKNLYEELNYDEVIQFGTITLGMSLKDKRYSDALRCYEYIVSAHIEKGDFVNFSYLMIEYEKLCLTYGEDYNKMIFYYLLSLLNTMIKDYDESIVAAKKSIKYAHYFQTTELIFINYSNIASQALLNGNIEKANIAMSLAEYYKTKMSTLNKTIVRGYVSSLYYYAGVGNLQQFKTIKKDFLRNLNEGHSSYKASIEITEGVLMFHLQDEAASLKHFERAFHFFAEHQSLVHLKIIEKCILRFSLREKFRYFDALLEAIQNAEDVTVKIKEVQSINTDNFFADELPAAIFKYPNVISKELIIQHVEEALNLNEPLYCIHWCYITDQLEALFGKLFVEQLLFTLFETTYHILFEFGAEVIICSKNEGEAIVKNISEKDFFKLLMELEKRLKLKVVHSTNGRVDIPIHFGFVHSDQLPQDQYSYDGLVAHADASLYYAKSHG